MIPLENVHELSIGAFFVGRGMILRSGDVLMAAGYPLPILFGDYQSLQLYLKAE
ncbi:MAG: GH36 C-terminal domain-containing protein [Oscillospiraceae bacterium]|nr:GH36 C-terminal domain-containing protein [Oscillospiraceae bacterium]